MKDWKIYLIALWVCFGSACTHYLDIKPYGQTIPETPEEFAALLHNRLNDIDYGNDGVVLGNAGEMLDYECYADNLDATLSVYFYPQASQLTLYVGSRVNESYGIFDGLYEVIRDCNLVIHEMSGQDTDEGKAVLATAYALRGVSYYNLMRNYCVPYNPATASKDWGMPLVENFDIEKKTIRSELEATAGLIVSDLKEAIRFNQQEKIYRYTADVARAYLARTYFWTQNWKAAAELAEEVLTKYPLVEGQEYVDMIQDRYGQKSNVLLRSYIFPGLADNAYSTNHIVARCRPVSKSFSELFKEKGNDIRFALSFDTKRLNNKNICARVRSAEMCLILAEAYAHLGENDQALKYLNLLRSKRISPYTPYSLENLPEVNTDNLITQDAVGISLTRLMSAILCERQKELYMEGDRWFELKRNGRPEFWVANDGQKCVTYPFLYTFPIPASEMILVPEMQQNEGYTL